MAAEHCNYLHIGWAEPQPALWGMAWAVLQQLIIPLTTGAQTRMPVEVVCQYIACLSAQ